MKILAPGDPNEVKYCLKYIIENPVPSYLRLGKNSELTLTNPKDYQNYNHKKKVKYNKKNTVAIITTGTSIQILNNAIKNDNGIFNKANLYTCPIWGDHNKKIVSNKFSKYKKIITLEDHFEDGGFGSWFLEASVNYLREKVLIMGLKKNIIYDVASDQCLLKKGGLSIDKLLKYLNEF